MVVPADAIVLTISTGSKARAAAWVHSGWNWCVSLRSGRG